MYLLSTESLIVLSAFGIFTFIIAEVVAKDLPIQYLADFSDGAPVNEFFFKDVRALINQRVNENEAIKKLHLETHNNLLERDISTNSPYGNVSKPNSYAPTPVLVKNWPVRSYSFGQITAVSVDGEGNPVIFHRADRCWDINTFNESNIYYMIEYGPIQENTIFVLDPESGLIKSGWGYNFFYMPHGMTIDGHGNYWITDVAMHQAFKFKPYATQPMLTFGKRFIPGSSTHHLCKPTSIAVSTTGEVSSHGKKIY